MSRIWQDLIVPGNRSNSVSDWLVTRRWVDLQ
jgi:hypothetical protein